MLVTKRQAIYLFYAAVFPLSVSCAFAGRIYVDADSGAGAGSGSSWADAYLDLQSGLSAASSGDEIRVAQGVYKPAGPAGDRSVALELINGVTVKGGFAGFGETDPNERNISAYETTLSGDLDGDDGPNFVNNSENSFHVVTGSGTDRTAVFDGFTVTAGNADIMDQTARGGGMYIFQGDPTVTNCTFSKNYALTMGGGMFNQLSEPLITNCIFIENRSDDDGGGMRNYQDSHAVITNCKFINNSAFEDAGGLGNRKNSNAIVTYCEFIGNVARSGGGMENHVGQAIPTGQIKVANCIFVGNTAFEGGGMRNNDPSPTVTNCLFLDNTGGGMQNRSNSPVVTNCIFRDNLGGSLTGDGFPIVTFCNVQGGFTGTGNIDTDPLFIQPDDYHLSSNSPCIDTGDPNFIPMPDETDFDGLPRIMNGRVDMGVYENIVITETETVPNVVGMTEPNATTTITDAGLILGTVTYACSDTVAAGNVISQNPIGGTSVAAGSSVDIVVSTGQPTVPNVVGQVEATAIANINAVSDISAGTVTYACSDTVLAGNVISQSVTGTTTCGNTVDITVSTSQPSVPDVTGLDEATAISNINSALGISTGTVTYANSATIAAGNVVSQTITGIAPCGTTVDLTVSAGPYLPITYYVDDNAPEDPGPGDPNVSDPLESGTIDHPFDAIQQAVDASSPSDTIIVADGTYTGLGNRDIDFTGKAITLVSKNGPEKCIINCNGNASEPHRGFYFHSAEDANSVVEGFTIINGYASNVDFFAGTEQSGGAVYCNSSSPVFFDCIFSGNSAVDGGAIANYYSDPFVINCLFTSNSAAPLKGGGMANAYSKPVINNCTFVGNTGRGINNYNFSPVITNSIFRDNSGGSCDGPGSPILTFCNIENGFPGLGNIDIDPNFVNPGFWDANSIWVDGDYHLLSQAGYFDPNTATWLYSQITSRCIDAGIPGSWLYDEPADSNNLRINMGVYGGTAHAAKTPPNFSLLADLTNDGTVDLADLASMLNDWQTSGIELPADFDRNDFIDIKDLFILARDWLKKTSWN